MRTLPTLLLIPALALALGCGRGEEPEAPKASETASAAAPTPAPDGKEAPKAEAVTPTAVKPPAPAATGPAAVAAPTPAPPVVAAPTPVPPVVPPAEVAKPPAAPVPAPERKPAAPVGPVTVVYPGAMGKVTFTHAAHGKKLGCASCHGASTPQKLALTRDSAHQLCKGCHEKQAVGPTKCLLCHIK